jgi:hypothetical protein
MQLSIRTPSLVTDTRDNMNILAQKIGSIFRDLQGQSSGFLENASNEFHLIIVIYGGQLPK